MSHISNYGQVVQTDGTALTIRDSSNAEIDAVWFDFGARGQLEVPIQELVRLRSILGKVIDIAEEDGRYFPDTRPAWSA